MVAGSVPGAVVFLNYLMPVDLDKQVWDWHLSFTDGPFTQHSDPALAVLRIAVTIAGATPVRLGDEVNVLDERSRLLVGAALAQMLAGSRR